MSNRMVRPEGACHQRTVEHDINIESNEVGSERTENCFWRVADIPDISAFALLDALRI